MVNIKDLSLYVIIRYFRIVGKGIDRTKLMKHVLNKPCIFKMIESISSFMGV